MRDILNDLEAGKFLSDPDPVRRAQIQMKKPLPKRFYKAVSVALAEDRFAVHLARRAEPLRLAALHLMTSLTGSALLALAVDFGELDGEAAWAAGHVDEDWQVEHWGKDAEAVARRSARKRDMMAAISLLDALKA
jgi:chaperone required for assembly of F1-ATPase